MTRQATKIPTEAQEQQVVVDYLRRKGVLFTATLNGHNLKTIGQRVRAAKMGAQPGVPDILIFETPPGMYPLQPKGAAIEMKRRKGGVLSDEQERYHKRMRENGWTVVVCRGAADALNYVQNAWGY